MFKVEANLKEIATRQLTQRAVRKEGTRLRSNQVHGNDCQSQSRGGHSLDRRCGDQTLSGFRVGVAQYTY